MGDTTKYPVENHAAWREKVQDYVDAGDRGEEPVYVGREDLFDKVDRMARSAVHGQTDSRTVVIAGAPGAGKTLHARTEEALERRRSRLGRVAETRWVEPLELGRKDRGSSERARARSAAGR